MGGFLVVKVDETTREHIDLVVCLFVLVEDIVRGLVVQDHRRLYVIHVKLRHQDTETQLRLIDDIEDWVTSEKHVCVVALVAALDESVFNFFIFSRFKPTNPPVPETTKCQNWLFFLF